MINIAELLEDAPKGMKLYSPLFGEVKFKYINDSDFGVVVEDSEGCYRSFDKYGRYFTAYNSAECLLFPSMGQTWEGWEFPITPKPHYDIANLKPFDKVLVRDRNDEPWRIAFYGYYNEEAHYSHFVGTCWSKQCIPFEGNEHLLGTTEPCGEEFINW